MIMKIRLLMLGRTRRPEMNAVLGDYVKRIARACPIEVAEVRDGEAAIRRLGNTRDCFCLWGCRRIPGDAAGTREAEDFAECHDVFARTGARDAGGADLPGVCDLVGEPVSKIKQIPRFARTGRLKLSTSLFLGALFGVSVVE